MRRASIAGDSTPSFEASGGLREQLGPGDGAFEIRNLGIVVAHSSSSS